MSGSRLMAVKKTIIDQINDMKLNYPDRKVGFVTFSDIIRIYGDGTQESNLVDHPMLCDYDYLLSNAKFASLILMNNPISKTHPYLCYKV
jgi:hypothetical protein